MNDKIPPTDNLPFKDGASKNTGHIIVRLDKRETSDSHDLQQVAVDEGFQNLLIFLTTNPQLKSERVIQHTTPDVLRQRELIAVQTSFAPLESLTAYWRIDVREHPDSETVRSLLHNMPEVAIAYHESEVQEAASDNDPVDSNVYERNQHFLDAKPHGVNARAAWEMSYGDGGDVNVVDLEAGWILAHEDLPQPQLLYGADGFATQYVTGDHGAAVLGVIGGVNNDIGIIGIAPKVSSLNVVSHFDVEKQTGLHVADAIDAATKHLEPGDVLLLEVQRCHTNQVLPTEIESADLHAIRHTVAQGIIVIEAAGNGGVNLDTWEDPTGQHVLDMKSGNHVDSGAIMVGSCFAPVVDDKTGFQGHRRYYTSNYGSRVGTYAWGEQICTTGYGTIVGRPGGTSSYTNSFGQTSGASAIIAGVAAVVQSWHKATHGRPLTPEEMRETLSDPKMATPQVNVTEGAVGVMPDLGIILSSGTKRGQSD